MSETNILVDQHDDLHILASAPSEPADTVAASPAQARIPAQFMGELIHATDVAHMACIALVARGIVNSDVFQSFAGKIEQGWIALEANSQDHNQAAIAWARRRMADFLAGITFGQLTTPERRLALAELMPAPLCEGDTATADAETAAQEQ